MKTQEFIYGMHAVRTVLQTRPQDVLQLYIQGNRIDKKINEIKKLAESFYVPCELLSAQQLQNKVGETARHQGVVAKCRALSGFSEKELMSYIENTEKPIVLLILDGVQDPHNLGACLRSANAFGVHAVIAPKDRAASITEVVRKVASGAAEQTPFIAVTNLHRTIKQLQEKGVWFVGLDSTASKTLSQIDLKGHIGIIMGSEGDGLRRLTKEACDYLAHIPMQGTVESLNVSVATGVALYEIQRQRQ
ncbi:MAG: 23S rRNA (guanosine(2251)-2'-O)-methyltransferase RlmB [Gammaproteobacteria bacterium CG_4_10_14_0_8_um_filter_38_16]|nr:MAG: 23S rRNA (guanosine(2251)-2'-O)-methyltransferase RlmB [Gammaproteobacteria bacterium CG_4_10_14_0_8_um_filter_38_16]PJA03050.1 MAG: 23S rRNA (guanosine(2251)-2'-O)-methyltransferase RlmB [Gammaproteobacteria bacterium CG_4_10_14_0_2_um_filter_38_22]PJB10220.1 MAG: 23S rRNA (guanosine(2251)-2'-O)-methyltransferase RlmB [Gammaproteobacteria bacterium CG_4_9_14_3_um_filter_38_9]